jgi:plasmid stabilization system protein ParE
MRLLWSFGARDELLAIAEYLSESSEVIARRWVGRLRDQAWRAIGLPFSGRVVPEFGRTDVREFIYRAYRIVYLVRDSEIVVLSVFEGHRSMRLAENDLPKSTE